ncbi:MAG: transposase family protein [Bryobacterales bacterium]|nr:transposase family protein [Bryobacterales bacterium]
MKDRSHSLPSFSTFLNKGFDLRSHAGQMADARTDPDISPSSVFLALFHAFVFRLPSFQQLDSELAHSYLQQWIGAERAFRDDTLRYSLCGFDLDPLEAMLVDVNRRLKRSKAFDQGRVQGRLVAALDGIEVLSSFSRRCENCLERRVIGKDQAGRKIEQTQYYHRAVGCQMVHSPVKPFLAIEWLRPGEGEDTAALRLLTRLPDLYGSRFFDILLLDALYAQTPVLQLIQKARWDAVISLKQNSRELYQSAMGLFAHRPADTSFTDRRAHKTYHVQLWDTEGLPFTVENPEPVRVVRSEEVLERNRFRQGKRTSHSTDHEWLWVTTLPRQAFPAAIVRQLGHSRWKNENNGWMDLTKHCAFKHGFLHACQHRPKQINSSGEREPVPNRGLAAVTLILLIAFALTSVFVLRHSKLARIDHLTVIAVAAQLHAWTSKAPPSIRAPD